MLVNESAIKTLGLKEVIGERIPFGTVIGVVSDFNMYSIHEAINPMIIGLNPSMVREIAIINPIAVPQGDVKILDDVSLTKKVSFFQSIINAISNFFKKLFGIK